MDCKTGIILAAGEGKRMKSALPKVLHQVCGRPMLGHVMEALKEAGVEKRVIVIGHGGDRVRAAFEGSDAEFAVQAQQLGTGHAVMQAAEFLPDTGSVVVLCGDTPLLTGETLRKLAEAHEASGKTVTVLTAEVANPFGYGRIVRGDAGQVLGIVEEKDATDEQRKIREVNSGMYCFDSAFLKAGLSRLTVNNAQGEYYLTDIVKMAAAEGKGAAAYMAVEPMEISGVNDRVQLGAAAAFMRRRINEYHMRNGVTIIDPAATYIDAGVEIGIDTVIYPGVILKGQTKIGTGCLLGHNCRLENAVIGNGTDIQSSTILDSSVGDDTHVGPYAYMRPGSKVGSHCKVGDFVEIKNSTFGDYSKSAHLAYIGDADVGQEVNVGCGVVFVNYDGVHKYHTTVKDRAFVGSNANVVAPVTIGEDAYIAAGTTVTMDIKPGALCVGRTRETELEGWVEQKGLLKSQNRKK